MRALQRVAGLLLLVAAAAGCDGSANPVQPEPQPVVSGALQIEITGLPADADAALTVERSGGPMQTVTASGILRDLVPGIYIVAARSVVLANLRTYTAAPASQAVTVASGSTARINVAYIPATSSTTISLDRIVDSIRVAFALPALAGAIVKANDPDYALGVAGTRRSTGGAAVTASDLWHLGSNFKAFTSMLAATAVDRGRIDWTTTVAQALPDLSSSIRPEYQTVTLRDLLAHRSGFPRDPAAAAITGATRTQQRASVAAWGVAQTPASAKGSYFYSNLNYMIAGAMLERALGTVFEAEAGTALLARLGITDAGFGPQAAFGSNAQPVAHRLVNGQWQVVENFDNSPVYSSAGGVHMSLPSWSRFIQEILRVEAGAPTIASLAASRETTSSLTPIAGADHYGMGWVVTSRSWAGGRTLWHNGTNTGNYSVTWLAPLRGFGVLAATNSYDGSAGNRTALALDALVVRLIVYHDTGR